MEKRSFNEEYDSYVNEWFSYEPHQASVLQSLSLIRESEDGSPYRYMTSPKDRGYHSLVSSNMLAYWVDTRMIPVNKDDWTIGWNIHQENTDQPYSKEDWVMFLESYYLSETGVTSRFEKKKSLVYFNQ